MFSGTKKNIFFLLIFIIATGGGFFVGPESSTAFTANDKYVRVANYYLVSSIKPSNYERLASYDLIVLPMEAQIYDKNFFDYARNHNPDIIILAYVPSQSINIENLSTIRRNLKAGIQSSWWLKDTRGHTISTWPGILNTNANSGWSQHLADYVKHNILSTGLWDGVFYDMVWENVSWVNDGNIDMDLNGRKDDATTADKKWKEGVVDLLSYSHQVFGQSVVIVINGSSISEYQPYINGRMFESFPTPWEHKGQWIDSMHSYEKLSLENKKPFASIINSNSSETGINTNYQLVRYGLSSALMGDGFFSFDYGISSHAQLWWYDEFDAYLGKPVGDPKNLSEETEDDNEPASFNDSFVIDQGGFWRRDFQKGMVLVNSTKERQTISFDEEFEKLHGTQDSTVNDGSIVNYAVLEPEDGLVLLRPIEKLIGSVFQNGSYARIFNQQGQVSRSGFFTYESDYKGGTKIIVDDINNDGINEFVVSYDNRITIFDSLGNQLNRFYPYGTTFDQGINFAVGDLDGNGTKEIVTGTENGGGPHIRIFSSDGRLINPGFFAYGENFRGGVTIAIGDLDGNGQSEIITGAGVGGGPHVRVFNQDGRLINPGFFAYDPGFRGGVNVAAGDLDGDGIDEIITGPGQGGQPMVKVFDYKGGVVNLGFFAFDVSGSDGVKVAATDLEGDGKDEIIATTTDVFTTTISDEIINQTNFQSRYNLALFLKKQGHATDFIKSMIK